MRWASASLTLTSRPDLAKGMQGFGFSDVSVVGGVSSKRTCSDHASSNQKHLFATKLPCEDQTTTWNDLWIVWRRVGWTRVCHSLC